LIGNLAAGKGIGFLGTVPGAPGSPNGTLYSFSPTVENGGSMLSMIACRLYEFIQDAAFLLLARLAVASLELFEVSAIGSGMDLAIHAEQKNNARAGWQPKVARNPCRAKECCQA
jgi:hypothetical protein